MTQKDKLLKRFLAIPKDFTINELTTIMNRLGFVVSNKGATSGSRMAYINKETGDIIRIHRPHPEKIIGPATLKDVITNLKDKGFI
jgi:hypothetical protein